ncbi:hypothetical protein BHE74_00040512, partial [Ensete ventricosum]
YASGKLDVIKPREEKSRDIPPALPIRLTLRPCLPSSRGSLSMSIEMGSNEAGFSSNDSDVMKEKARSELRELGHGIKVKKKKSWKKSSLGGPVDEKGGRNDYVKKEVT